MEAAVAHSCAIFLAQNIWLDGFCSVVSYYEILSPSQKRKGGGERRVILPTKLVLERDFNFPK